MEPTADELLELLAAWAENPNGLIGIYENQAIEFKRTAYVLSAPAAKLEFAKDVSAMANGGGGVIVLGVETSRDPAMGRDRSVKIRPLTSGTVDISSMESVAREWIYPPMRDLLLREWVDDSGRLLISISVPSREFGDGPSLVRGAEVEDRIDRRLFTIANRFDGRVDTYTPGEVHDWIRRGIKSLTTPEFAIPAGPQAESSPLLEGPEAADRFFARARDSLDSEWPVFILQAWARPSGRLTGLHDGDGVKGLLRDPPALRATGFNMRWWGAITPELDEGGGIRLPGGRRGMFWLTPRGTMTLAATAGPDLLGWAMDRRWAMPTLNPLVLSELTFEAVRLYLHGVIKFLEPIPSQTVFRIGLVNALSPQPTTMPKGGLENPWQEGNETGDSEFVEMTGPVEANTDPAQVGSKLIRSFYAHFGLGKEDIPYLTADGSAIDIEAIANHGK